MYDTPENYENVNQAELAKQRNTANNANNIRNIADEASKSSNAYAKAIGGAVKAADKISGGKSTEALGKAMDRANKFAPGGRLAQNLSNRMSESGTSDRISSALSKKNNATPATGRPNNKNSAVAPGKDNSFLSKKEVEEQTSDGGGTSFKATVKFLKTAMVAFAPIMIVVVFMNLIVSGSQTYLGVIGLDQADKVSSTDAETKIRDNGSEGLDKEITDENVDEGVVGFNDLFIDDNNVYSKKLTKENFIDNERPYSEAELEELEDFYSGINGFDGYDMDTVYKFFFKLLYIHKHYLSSYNVDLDMALIMATLNVQSEDRSEVFIANTKDYKVTPKENNEDFKYNKAWSTYTSTKTESSHDIELLAKNMVTKTSDGGCYGTIDGGCYKIDQEKYKEFLKEFLEKKYYTEGGYTEVSSGSNWVNNGICPTETPFNKYVLTDEQLILLTSRAMAEQGTPKGAAAEASLMANLFELKGSKYGTGGEGLYNYVVYGGWFGSSKKVLNTNKKLATPEAIEAVKSVLVDGKRTLPGYINEHDCINCTKSGGDISSITIDGVSVSKTDKANYIQHKTVINNVYGATYTFYSFPTETSDPFGYTKQSNREKIGDFYYDFDTGQPVNCSVDPSKDGNYTSDVIYNDTEFGNIRYYNQGDYKKYYYSSDPNSKAQYKNGKSAATISSHGCGPTSLSIVLSSLLNRDINPIETTTKVCLAKGCTNDGSKYKTLISVANEYGINAHETANKQEVINALNSKNSLVIVLMGPGTFTTSGHYIVLTGVNSSGQVSVADPASRKRTEKKWYSFNTIVEQRKTYAGYMIFSR